MTEKEDITCPVCKKHDKSEARGAEGVVISAATALINGDDETIMTAYQMAEPYDFHIAVTLFVQAADVLAEMMGCSVDDVLDDLRGQLNDAQTDGR